MAEYVPYVLLAAGIQLILMIALLNTVGLFNGILFRLVPGIVGGVCLWASAVTFIGGGL